MELADLLGRNAAAIAAMMAALWVVASLRRDASVVDLFWGAGFALVAGLSFAGAGGGARETLLCALTILWGLRLSAFLTWRNWGEPEDRRYAAMRERHGNRFVWVSAATVFTLQGVLMWVVSLPIPLGVWGEGPPGLGPIEALGLALFAVGLGFETVGDLQLARFRADPRNAGRVLDRGLWRLTRHPNYFGDCLVWWGLWALALRAPLGPWSAVGPALMTLLLLKVSGVALLEQTIAERRPEYADYLRRTPAFFPRWPRR